LKFDLLNKKVFSIFFLFAFFISPYSKLLANSQIKSDEEVHLETTLDKNFYIIGPGDTILLDIYSNKEFSGLYKVLPDGNVSLPLIGNIRIQNLSLDQAITLLEKEYSKELLRPELNISVKDERPIKVSLIGEIKRPGIYALSKLESLGLNPDQRVRASNNPTIFDAIQKAGGITSAANLKDVRIIRKIPGNKVTQKQASLNLLNVITSGDQMNNLVLFDGDIIKINKAEQLSNEIINLADSALSPSKVDVTVVGNVVNPGTFPINSSSTIIQAVYRAGGPINWRANKNKIELIRIRRNGTIFKKSFKLNSKKISTDKSPRLNDGDILYVHPSLFGNINTALKTITEPLSSVVTTYSLIKIIGDE